MLGQKRYVLLIKAWSELAKVRPRFVHSCQVADGERFSGKTVAADGTLLITVALLLCAHWPCLRDRLFALVADCSEPDCDLDLARMELSRAIEAREALEALERRYGNREAGSTPTQSG